MTFDAKKHCGAKSKRTGSRCRNVKGFKTDHVGAGNCYLHGGRSPNGRQHGRVELAKVALADLAIPVAGNPLQVLQAALEAAHGVMLGGRALLKQLDAKADAATIEARLKIYFEAIERASRVAKTAAEALNEDDLVRLNVRTGELIHRILQIGLDAADAAGGGNAGRQAAEEAITRELVAVGPTRDEQN